METDPTLCGLRKKKQAAWSKAAQSSHLIWGHEQSSSKGTRERMSLMPRFFSPFGAGVGEARGGSGVLFQTKAGKWNPSPRTGKRGRRQSRPVNKPPAPSTALSERVGSATYPLCNFGQVILSKSPISLSVNF